MKHPRNIHGAGMGLRREHIADLKQQLPKSIDFFELAPENWMQIGGKRAKDLHFFAEHYPLICHGLSLSLGGPSSLNEGFLQDIKTFLDKYKIAVYSEHLSYCSDTGYLYDLMPIPFTQEAVDYVAKRIQRTQEILERRIAVENVSYYAAPGQQMSEIDFINVVLAKADCDLLLDVNNIYVNSINHGYDAVEFLRGLKPKNIAYIHIAGHYQEDKDLIIDTHGANIVGSVWTLLEKAYQYFGIIPTLLERDFNIPALNIMLKELDKIKQIQQDMFQKLESNNV